MIFKTAQTSLAVKLVTAFVFALMLAFVAGGLVEKHLPLAGLFLGLVTLICYLLAPVAYDTTDGQLTVLLRTGKIHFGPIASVTQISGHWPFTVRLFGNGGVFAGTGIYWNKPYGVFRAYVTSARPADAVLVQTQRYKVVLTPENPQAFLAAVTPLPA